LENTSYTDEELRDLLCDVIDEINKTRNELGDSNYVYPSDREVFSMAFDAYQNVKKQFPYLEYKHKSIKPSLLTTIVSYAGYSGYYNPFSGEAQVNTDMPKFYMPFVMQVRVRQILWVILLLSILKIRYLNILPCMKYLLLQTGN
jgi:hypothetical protein